MFGIMLVTKDMALQKRVENFCDKYGFVLLNVKPDLKRIMVDLEEFSPEFLLVDEKVIYQKENKKFFNICKKIKIAIFSHEESNKERWNAKNICFLSRVNFSRTLLKFASSSNLLCFEKRTVKIIELKKNISTFCLEAGIMPHLSGYKYVVYAIILAILDVENTKFLTKQIYPKVAQKFGVSAQIVERTIRHALIVAGQNGKLSKLNELIEADVFVPYERISNGQFISIVADRFLYKLKILSRETVDFI